MNTKVRINLTTREFEVEGTESFVVEFTKTVGSLLDSLGSSPPDPRVSSVSSPTSLEAPLANPNRGDTNLPDNFGEYFHLVPKGTVERDLMLIAGYFAQSQAADASFATGDASKLLLDQGVKISNPSMCISRNIGAKYLMQLGKRKFRVSREGIEHIAETLRGQ